MTSLIVQPKGAFVYVAKPDGKKVATMLGAEADKYDYAYKFAAADEMLAVLKEVVAVSDRATAVYDRARAAIAKAEARQP